jgi:large subunit ribosomal protein L4
LWRGGGTVFGPRPRSYAFSMPRKARKLGLRMALSSRFGDDLVLVMDDFRLEEAKTKRFIEVMKDFAIDNALIVVPGKHHQPRAIFS